MSQIAVGPQVSQVWTGNGPVLLANQDLVNAVTIGNNQGISIDGMNGDVIPALGSIGYIGGQPLFAIAPAGTAALTVIAGGTSWAPSPAQVALQIEALGLAKDTSVQQVHTSVSGLSQTGQTIAQEAQTLGGPPFVPQLKSATVVRQSVAVTPFFTFPSAGRIWAIDLSYFITTNNSYAVSTSQTYAALETGSGKSLAIVELGASNPNQGFGGQSTKPLNGLPIVAGDTLILDVNNGAVISNLNQRASVVVLYSVP